MDHESANRETSIVNEKKKKKSESVVKNLGITFVIHLTSCLLRPTVRPWLWPETIRDSRLSHTTHDS